MRKFKASDNLKMAGKTIIQLLKGGSPVTPPKKKAPKKKR